MKCSEAACPAAWRWRSSESGRCWAEAGGAPASNPLAPSQAVHGLRARKRNHLEERAALPILAHGAAMRFFLTRLNDWGATPAGALVKPKDPLEYERKLAVHRASHDLVLFDGPLG